MQFSEAKPEFCSEKAKHFCSITIVAETEIRNQKTESRKQKTEIRKQKSENRKQKAEAIINLSSDFAKQEYDYDSLYSRGQSSLT